MLDMHFIRENTEAVRENLRRKDESLLAVLDELLEKDAEWRALKQETDSLRAERNRVSKAVNEAKKKGEDASRLIAEAKRIPERIREVEDRMQEHDEQHVLPRLRRLPNMMHADVPRGGGEADNPVVKTVGDAVKRTVKNHVELCEERGLADFEASAATSGSGFYFLRDDLALLNQALIQYAIGVMRKHGYRYVEPPLMVRPRILDAAMDAEGFAQTIYKVDDGNALIGTSEHALLGMLEGATMTEQELPLKLFAYSMCFRKEIGSHGINEKGLWRTHQFNKVEMFQFTTPEQSWKAFDEMLAISEEVLQGLKLPYRVVDICTGDLSLWKARSHDVEVWRPTLGEYGEVMSLSNCTDYQARDLNIRLSRKGGYEVVHTLNNTVLATSRIMVAILENYQNEDGTVTVPEALRAYMGKESF